MILLEYKNINSILYFKFANPNKLQKKKNIKICKKNLYVKKESPCILS